MITGTVLALSGGVLLGLFMVFHQKAGETINDRLLRMIILLAASTTITAIIRGFSGTRAHLGAVPWDAILYFAIGGLFNFFFGFHLMSVSQAKVGAGRTGLLIGTTPVFSAVIGFLVFAEKLAIPDVLGIAVVLSGVLIVSKSRISGRSQVPKWNYVFGIATALSYAVSPLFLRYGLRTYNSALTAVVVGMATSLTASVILLVSKQVRRSVPAAAPPPVSGTAVEIVAGVCIGIATWIRYVAFTMLPLAVVTTLSRINIPILLILAPLVLKSDKEAHTRSAWIGAVLIIAGTAVIGFY